MILKLKDVLPNPNRDLKRNPLDPQKVKALVDSINATGFWDNVVVRKNAKGKYESAYGHTRIAAAIKAGLTEADFIVKDFDDEQMIKVMGLENSESYQYSILALLEKVRAVVIGLSDGRVKPFEISADTPSVHILYAPSFVPDPLLVEPSCNLHERRYTTVSVAKFLEMTSTDSQADNSVKAALGALRLIQLNKMTEHEIKYLKVNQLLKVNRERTNKHEVLAVSAARKAETQRLAGLSIQQRQKEEAAAQKLAEAEAKRLHKEQMEATRLEDEEKAKRIAEEQKENERQAAEREQRRKELEREFNANQKEREQSLEAQRKAKDNAEKKAEATRVGFVSTIRQKIDRLLSNEDALFDMLKTIGRDKRTTDKERDAVIKDLEDACDRVMRARVFVRPELAKNLK